MAEELEINPGPTNTTLLYLTEEGTHISDKVWNGKPDKILKVRRSRDSQIVAERLIRSVPDAIRGHLEAAGFYHCALVSDVNPDPPLISAFIERWCPETHTFHLPFGECSITLQDIAIQLGLKIDGDVVTGPTSCNWPVIIEECLGRIPPADKIRGGALKMKWINENFNNVLDFVDNPQDLACFARAYIMRMLGGFLLPDHSGSHVPLRYLPLLRNFHEAGKYSWGSAVLAHLYKEMCHASKSSRVEIGGCVQLIQFWVWTRFPGVGPLKELNLMKEGCALGARWEENAQWIKYQLPWWRHYLDTLKTEQFVWMPYSRSVLQQLPPICRDNMDLWRCIAPMIAFFIVEWHQPDRVMQQFGLQQHVPRKPHQTTDLHDMTLSGKHDWDWVEKLAPFISAWNNRHNQLADGPRLIRLAEGSDEYMRWYSQHSRRWLTRKGAALGQLAANIHHIWYGMPLIGQGRYTIDNLQRQAQHCLALCEEMGRITIPSLEAPPTEPVQIPDEAQDYHPKLGRNEGRGLHRKEKKKERAQPVKIDVPQQLPSGKFWLAPTHTGDSYTSYHYSGDGSSYQGHGSASGFQQQDASFAFQQPYQPQQHYSGGGSREFEQYYQPEPVIESQPYHGSAPQVQQDGSQLDTWFTPQGQLIPSSWGTPPSPQRGWGALHDLLGASPNMHHAHPPDSEIRATQAAFDFDLNQASLTGYHASGYDPSMNPDLS